METLHASLAQSIMEYGVATDLTNLEVTWTSSFTVKSSNKINGGVADTCDMISEAARFSCTDIVPPYCKNQCPCLESSVVNGKAEEDASLDQILGTSEGWDNMRNESRDVEKGNNLAESQATKKVELCVICHEKIKPKETAEIKGCEHTYCVTCILRWACYKADPWCPQCRLPFQFLNVYRSLDGSLSDYLFEESVFLLRRAFWFEPLVIQEAEEQDDYQDDYDVYEERYHKSKFWLGNRRWGNSGYVRAGRHVASPIGVCQVNMGVCSTHRRARRAQKQEQLDKNVGRK